MKCTKCGKKVKKDVKMCPYCGNDSFEETNNKFVETIKGKKKIILGVGIPVIVLFIAFLVTWNVYLKYDKINVNEYLEVNLDTDTQGNYDGAGEYIIFFDSEKLSREVVRSASKKIKKSVASEIIDDIIDVKEPKKNGSFKNGDICKVTIKYTNKKLKEYNIMLTGGTVKKRVKNLKKTTKLDPFEGAAMVTKGAAPNVKIKIDNIHHPGLNQLYYVNGGKTPQVDKEKDDESYDDEEDYDDEDEYDEPSYDEDDFGDGEETVDSDQFTINEFDIGDDVEVEIYTKIYEEKGVAYLLTRESKTYTLEKAATHITKATQLTDKTMKNVINESKDYVLSSMKRFNSSSEDYEVFDAKYTGSYFLLSKEKNDDNYYDSYLFFAFETYIKMKGESKKKAQKWYQMVEMKNPLISTEGVVEGTSTDMSISEGYNDYSLFVDLKEAYENCCGAYGNYYNIYALGKVKKY